MIVHDKAFALLENPESYPGLPTHKFARTEMRLWIYPSFTPAFSWSVLKTKKELFVRRIVWDLRKQTLLDPVTYGAEATLPAQVLSELLAQLTQVRLLPFNPNATVGLDGTRYGVEVGDQMSATTLTWWQTPPPSWEPLAFWHKHAVARLDALLPKSTTSYEYAEL